jgi:glycosyltransferase involved in cell wall biosynthesis
MSGSVHRSETDRRIRVVLYQTRLSTGGAQDVTLTLLRHLRRDRFEPVLVVRQGDGEWMDRIPRDVPFRVLDARVRSGWLKLASALRAIDPDVVLSMSSTGNLTTCLGHWVGRLECPLIVSERNSFSDAWANSRWRGPIRAAKKLLYRRAKTIVTVSRGVGDDLARTLGIRRERMVTIYNPIVDPLLDARAKESIEHPWFAENVPIVLGVGRLVAQKDFETLLRAFHRVREGRDARLVILGDGELRGPLMELAAELGISGAVSFPGFVSNPAPYMHGCSVFVLSSKYEGLPGVLIQAMACGAPVISTDCPSGPAEILADGESGILIPPGNSEALARAIGDVLEDGRLRASLAAHGKARAQDFSVERSVERFEELLEDTVLGSRRFAPMTDTLVPSMADRVS